MCTLFCHALKFLTALIFLIAINFYPNVTTLRSGLCCRNSVSRLSIVCLSVTLVHPTQGVEPLGKIFFTAVYAGHPLTSVQDFTEIVAGEPPPSGALNARGVSK